jgi:hypothetical protein
MPPGPKLGFALFVGMDDAIFDIILGIPNEKGLETKGMD